MTDQREAIMQQIETLLASVDGIRGVYRDRGELPPQEKTPGIVLLDGKEEIKNKLAGYNFTAMPPAIFTLLPQIFLVLSVRDTVDNSTLDGVDSPVWSELSSFRIKIIRAMATDETLVAMIGDNGSVEYRGFDSDMQTGSTIGSLGATMQFHFAISYVLDPSDL
jgi:hypothetical protein